MEKPTADASYPTIDDHDVENVQIPILMDDVLKQIKFQVNQCYETRAKSIGLIGEAIDMVEKAIETNS